MTLGALGLAGRAQALETDLEVATSVAGTKLGNVVLVSPLLGIGVPISGETGMIVKWGFTIASADQAGDLDSSRFQSGNAYVGFPIRFGEGFVFAPGVTLPTASQPDKIAVEGEVADLQDAPDTAIANIAINGGRAMRGTLDQWLWVADQFALVFPVHWAVWSSPLMYELDLKLAYLIPTRGEDNDDDFILQAAARVAWRIIPSLWIGARFGAVYIPTNTGNNASLSIEPDVRVMIRRGHIRASFLYNIDSPFGPSFDAGGAYGLNFGVSWNW